MRFALKYFSLNSAALLILIFFTMGVSAQDDKAPITSKSTINKQLGLIDQDEMCELSGIVSSSLNPNILWTHNDRNNKPYLYAIDLRANLKIAS